jgi:hypothetical protein
MGVSVFSVVDDNADNAVDASRTALANQVIDYLRPSLPDVRIAVLLDSSDWDKLKDRGEENRGAFYPVNSATYDETDWPFHLREFLVSVDETWRASLKCEGAVYRHNSTCDTPASLVMTLAHELQHAVQYATNRTVWAYNGLVTNLPPEWITMLGLEWKDIPIEPEARVVAKRACKELLGIETTSAYIADRIGNGTLDRDIDDWRFIENIVTSQESGYDITAETVMLFRRIDPVGRQLANVLTDFRKYPDFSGLHLEGAFRID